MPPQKPATFKPQGTKAKINSLSRSGHHQPVTIDPKGLVGIVPKIFPAVQLSRWTPSLS
ncbi:MAG: hypothetical protein QNL33_05670 [Akkermansiaceae bacterium]